MKPNSFLRCCSAIASSALFAVSSVNATQYWDGTGGDANWNTASNWGGDVIPDFTGTAINFGGTNVGGTAVGTTLATQTTANNDLAAGTTIRSIIFTNNGTAGRTQSFILEGNSIVLGSATNNGISSTALTTGGPFENIIRFNIDFGTVVGAQNRLITAGLNNNIKVEGVISGTDTDIALLHQGGGIVRLTNANNSYVGFTNIATATSVTQGSILEVTSLANGGSNSSIGASSNAAANLRFSNAFNNASRNTLRYIGSSNAETDRNFTLSGNFSGTNSVIESSGSGTLSFTNTAAIVSAFAVNRNFYLGGTNTGTNSFSLALNDFTAGGSSLTKEGVGKWIINGTNTYTGATTISDGTLQFAKQVSLYNNNTAGTGWVAANIKVASGGTLALNVGGTGEFDTTNVTTLLTNLGGANGTSTTGFAAGSRVGFDTTNAAGGNFTVADAIANSSGTGGGAIGLTKLGTGSLTLANTNTYTGATTVSAGTLIVNGSISDSVLTTVASGATIAGSGTIGTLTVSTGGFINPGTNPDVLDVAGAYTQAGTYNADITANTVGNGTTGYDQINVTGAVDITGGSLVATFSNGGYALNNLIFILLNDDVDAITGTYAGYANGATVATYGGFNWNISYVANSGTSSFTGGNDIALMAEAIPEPKAALLGALGVLLLLRRRRS
jgi:autotransporter-associated beta strand protein